MEIILLFLNLLIFILAAIILVKASIKLIETLITLAKTLKLPTFIVAFFFLALATSIPEFSIGIMSALQQAPQISLGNVVGSNISNITIIIGLAILIAGPITINKNYRKETLIAITISSIFIAISLDNLISQIDGLILLIIFTIYSYHLIKIQKKEDIRTVKVEIHTKELINQIITIIILIVLMLLSSDGIVISTTHIANWLNISPLVISLFIIAIGTSLPELASMIPAIKKDSTGISLGDILGSIIANATLVIGTTALIYPIQINNVLEYRYSALFTFASVALFYLLIRSKSNLSKKDALFLIFIYILFLLTQIFLEKSLS